MPGHSAGIGLPYDPGQARHLLAEAGYPGCSGFPGVNWLTHPFFKPYAEYLQAQWRENLGVEIAFETMEGGAYLDRLNREPPHIYCISWTADYPDPDNFLRLFSLQRWSRWRNKTYDRLIEEARGVLDQGKRMRLYGQADRVLVDEAAIIPLTYYRIHLLVKPWVSKYPTSAIEVVFWKDVIIEPH
jgi:ABC-type transport system substrate-binding protein